MALRRNRGTGQTVGANVTIANSDDFGESLFEFVTTTVAPTYDNLPAALTGYTRAFKLTPTSGSSAYMQYGGSTGDLVSDDIAIDCWVYRTNTPAAEYTLITGINTAGTRRINVNLDATGHLRGRAENATFLFTFTNALTLNAWNHVKVFSRNQGLGASLFKVALYDASGTLVEEKTTSTADRTGPIAGVGFGKTGTDTSATAFWVTDLQVDTVATDYIGAGAAPAIHSVQTSVTLVDATTSTGFASPLTISQVSGETGTATANGTNAWLVSIPSTGSAVWRLSGTSGASTITADVTVSAPPTGTTTTRGPKRSSGTLPSTTWA